MTRQAPLIRCGCGSYAVVWPTGTPHEFEWHCADCGRAGVISWNHDAPPPCFDNNKGESK